MSDKGKVRLMVVPIVAMLAVTMIVAGWQQEEQEIEVEEGLGELTIEHLIEKGEDEEIVGKTLIGKNETGVTIVNEESNLRFEVDPESIVRTPREQTVYLDLQVIGEFSEDLKVETMKIKANQMGKNDDPYNTVNFDRTEKEIVGGESWPVNQDKGGATFSSSNRSAYIGYDLDSNEFMAEGRIKWHFPTENVGENYTLELNTVVDGGISKQVVSTVQISIE